MRSSLIRAILVFAVVMSFAACSSGGGGDTVPVIPTYSISGTVTDGANPIAGATITLTGDASRTATTGTNGSYSIAGLSNGDYTITPSGLGYSFSPANRSVTISSSSSAGNDFTGVGALTISGTLSDGVNPIVGATVTLGGDKSASATTDVNGQYSFGTLHSGNYTVTPSGLGYDYTPASRNVTLAGSNSASNDFTGAGAHSISGTITDGTSPIAGATVTLGGDASGTATTDSFGVYTFGALHNGSYTLTPGGLGYSYAPASSNAAIAGADVTGKNFTGAGMYTVSGTVTDGANPISGATVNMTGDAADTTTTDGSGNFSFTMLPNGSYTLAISGVGYIYSPASANATVTNADSTGNNFTGAGAHSISGTLTDGTNPIAGATVTLSGAGSGSTTTSGSGSYTFGSLHNATYTIAPSGLGYSYAPASANVTISSANVTGRNFTGTGLYTVTGTITDGTNPISGATVTLGGDATDTTTTNASGVFSFPNLPNGTYTLTPSGLGYDYSPTISGADITDANSTGNNFTGTGAYSIGGTITDGTGPIAGITVTLTGDASDVAITDSLGAYTFGSLPNGSYTVTPGGLGYSYTPASASATISDASVTGRNFTGTGAYSIGGTITDGTNPIAGITVTLTGDASDVAITGAGGTYSFASLPNGSYIVTPEGLGYTFAPSATSVTVSGASATGQDFTGTGAHSISGAVTDGVDPIVGITITLGGDKSGTETTDTSGGYEFISIPNGNYTVTPDGLGYTYTPASRNVSVSFADSALNDFTGNYTITGTVTNTTTLTPIDGVQINMTGDSTAAVTTAADGTYTIGSMRAGSYALSATLGGYAFSPLGRTVTLSSGSATGQDFSGTVAASVHNISGLVRFDTGGDGYLDVKGVDIALTGTSSGNVISKQNGTFSFAGVPAGNYTLTPALSGYGFDPPNYGITLSADFTTAIFNASASCYSLFGNVQSNRSGTPLDGIDVSIDTSPALSRTTALGGSFGFSCLPDGQYTVTPALANSNAVFYPATAIGNIDGAGDSVWFSAAITNCISGTVSYGGTETGRVYVSVMREGAMANSDVEAGTSISGPGAYEVCGVGIGNFVAHGVMDHLGVNTWNAASPGGDSSVIVMNRADKSGVNITLTDPAPYTPSAPTVDMAAPSDSGAIVFIKTAELNNVGDAEYVDLYWSTTSAINTSAYEGTARLTNRTDIFAFITGLTNGKDYYFAATSEAFGNDSPMSAVYGPVPVGAAGGGSASVSGLVTFPGGYSGPLIVGIYSESGGGIYFEKIDSPVSPQAYSIANVIDAQYEGFAFIDVDGDMTFSAGDPQVEDMGHINISGPTVINHTLSTVSALANVRTSHEKNLSSNWESYNISISVDGVFKLPVGARITAGPQIPVPMDIAQSSYPGEVRLWYNLSSARPQVGDSYTFEVTYSDGTTGTMSGTVSAVLDGNPVLLYPLSADNGNGDTSPAFDWQEPSTVPDSFTYSFSVWGPGVESWVDSIPPTETTYSPVVTLTVGSDYMWRVTIRDESENEVSTSTTFKP